MKRQECARRLGACLVVGCAYTTYTPSGYADWEAVPDISLEAETNDNPAINTVGTTDTQLIDSANRLLADVILRIRKAEPRGEITFEPRVRGDKYAEEEARILESTDWFLRSNGVQRGQTVQLGYAADLAQERILGLEFLETLPADPIDDDPSAITTNQVGINEKRTRVGLAPYVEIAMNTRSTVRIDGRLVDVDYANDALPGRTDFLDRAIGGEYRRALRDQRGTFGVRLFASGYEAATNANTTDVRGVELVYAREMSELLSWNISGGTQRSDYALTTGGRRVRGTDDSPTFGLGIDKRGERSAMRTELLRRMSPDALGFVAPRDELRVSWTRKMSARVDGRLALRAIDAEGIPDVVGSERRYGRLELGLDWALRPTWSFITSYSYAKARSDVTIGDPAESNAVRIGVRYHGRSLAPGTFAQP
ncbi:MAG TPA: hypothetical protein VGL98_11900 [Gammaproteobacteria bacterium]